MVYSQGMRITCLQHVPFEGPGNIAAWAAEHGHSFGIVRLFEGQQLPDPDSFDLLVVMGGPMSVHDEAEFSWLVPEKRLVAECVKRGKFVLGVCLGSQLLAEVLGSQVYKNRVKEIGWFPIRLQADAGCLTGLPAEIEVLHWHGETYELPPGCRLLASSEGCTVQAFEHPSGLGLQFHFEVTAEGVADLIANCSGEIGSGPYEQLPDAIAAGEIRRREAVRGALFQVLDGIEGRMAATLQ